MNVLSPPPIRNPIPATRTLGLGNRRIPLVLPRRTDPRLHLSAVTITLFVLGIGWLGFRLSIPQILAAGLTGAAIEVVIALRRTGSIIWPASGLQTASSIALLLRASGTEAGDTWSFHGWYWFAGITAFALATKHLVRVGGRHVFNPSNVALVLGFVVIGSDRIEPLDLWWGPLDLPTVAAYAVILAGGVFITRRLGLLPMGIAFWLTLAAGFATLAVLGHSITAQWSLSPIADWHLWWIVVTSPEILIYLFFMLTDPRTVPSERVPRLVFGASVGGAAVVLAAPWNTEFGTKVGLLAGLTVVSAAWPLLERWSTDPLSRFHRVRRRLARPRAATGAALAAIVGFVAATVLSAAFAGAQATTSGSHPAAIPQIDPATMPAIDIDDNVENIDARVATPDGAAELAAALAWNLEVEAEALRTRDPSLLIGVDHGYRLEQLERTIAELGPDDPVVVPSYEFETLRLMIVYPGGAQAGANAGLVATGDLVETEHAPDGAELSRRSGTFATTFALRRTVDDGWQITDTLAVPK